LASIFRSRSPAADKAMSFFQIAMLCVMGAVAIVGHRHPRGLAWLGLLAIGYLISSFNWRWGGPAPELVAGLGDAGICVAIFFFGRYIWEMRLWLTCLMMLFVNFGYLLHSVIGAGVIPHDVYSGVLELLMLVALAIVGGQSAFVASGDINGRSFHPWRPLRGFSRSAADPVERGPSD
jgi:hypothetical protein